MTNAEILALFEKTVFPDFLGEYNVEEFVENDLHFPEDFNFDWKTGATKLVILPKDEDFVIKISFNGIYCNEQIDYDTGEILFEGEWEHFASEEYFYEEEFDGDYCGREERISNCAYEEDLIECFAAVECIGKYDDYFIYKQEKATCIFSDIEDEKKDSLTKEKKDSIRSRCTELNIYCFNICWIDDFLSFFGEEIFKQFNAFIESYHINDLHNSNIGYIGNRPVLIDYSGYFECC